MVKLDPALKAATRSTIRKHRTGAAIYDKHGNLLALGWSHAGIRMVSTPWSVHAEHHCLRRCYDLERAHTIVIATLTRCGNVTCGKPCPACAKKIKAAGIKNVIYT